MYQYKLVLPEHLNHYGYLHGGSLLQWVDEIGYIAANLEFPGHEFVTVGLDNVVFRKGITQGSILEFQTAMTRLGDTSVTYHVRVVCEDRETGASEGVFETRITYVSIDKHGKKKSIAKRPPS